METAFILEAEQNTNALHALSLNAAAKAVSMDRHEVNKEATTEDKFLL